MPREKFTDETAYGVLQVEGVSEVSDLYDRAWPFLDAGDTKTARALYEHALFLEPWNAQAHVGLGTCALQEKDFESAKRHYARGLELDPRSASAHLGLGSAHSHQNQLVKSVEHYEHALRLREDLPDAHWGAATTYEALGDLAQMRAHAKRFLELVPGSALAWHAWLMLRRDGS